MLQYVLSGLGIGCVYGLVALGFALTYQAARFFNFAHGAFFMLGAMGTAVLVEAGWSVYVAVLAATLAVGVFAVICERFVFRRFVLGGQGEINTIVEQANQYRQSDEKRRELAELRNNAEALLYTSERACEECAELVDAAIITQVRQDIAGLREQVNGSGDAISIRDRLQQLELSAYKIAEAMYGSADAPPAEAPKAQ